MSTVLRALGLSALLTLVPVGIGVGVSGDRTPAPEVASYRGTDLADFDTTSTVVRRAPFCAVVPEEGVTEALGGRGELAEYGNGEQATALPAGDVAHEYGCVWTGANGAEARAWVFAPPVTGARALEIAKAAPAKGCTATAGAPAFGKPSVALVCASGTTRTASYRGLFGDAWLSCSLTQPIATAPAELVERTGRWCVAVARAAATPAA